MRTDLRMTTYLDRDIEWHLERAADCRASIAELESEPDSLSRRAELAVLRDALVRYEGTLDHLQRLRRLTHAIQSGAAETFHAPSETPHEMSYPERTGGIDGSTDQAGFGSSTRRNTDESFG